MDKRFSRFEAMIGAEQIEALRHSHVMVVGVGGVGGGTVEALSRAGVGTLTLVDRDVVDITNMNRQVAALSSTVGMPKVEALAVRVRDVNPECDVRPLCVNLAADTVDELLSDRPDCVADCIDDMNAKVLLICECKRRGIPIVSSMGAGNRLDPSKLSITDVFRTENDPVARIMRKRLRDAGIKNLCVCASSELPKKCRVETSPGRFSPASAPFVPPVAGMIIASQIVRFLCGEEGIRI